MQLVFWVVWNPFALIWFHRLSLIKAMPSRFRKPHFRYGTVCSRFQKASRNAMKYPIKLLSPSKLENKGYNFFFHYAPFMKLVSNSDHLKIDEQKYEIRHHSTSSALQSEILFWSRLSKNGALVSDTIVIKIFPNNLKIIQSCSTNLIYRFDDLLSQITSVELPNHVGSLLGKKEYHHVLSFHFTPRMEALLSQWLYNVLYHGLLNCAWCFQYYYSI